ncbi:hypothetical protein RB628_01655 [Streptomyces sp. ADMS]|uniref:hypothetical protein n=1 Tax=Streptomyces sp. ADMS TaxID=3071415 RepID=UPI00296F06CF|nr:hypothetical protein [Streptomyces sp. ADMS]MDW4904073.1 hypothetical protein [Streptomyces sp. ADMS]
MVGRTAAGPVTTHAADDVFSRQHAERPSTRAVLLTKVPAAASGGVGARDRVAAAIRWTADDGSARTGRTLVETGQKSGARIIIWRDARSELTIEPPGPTEAACGPAFMGTATGAGALARWRIGRRRIAQRGTEWNGVEPQWRHRTR